MAKSNNVQQLTPDAAKEALKSGNKGEGFAAMRNADVSNLQELTSKYFSFEKIGSYFFIFHGMSKNNIGGKIQDAVLLEDEEGVRYINNNAVMVNALATAEVPCYVRADYEGEEKGRDGTYKNIKVYTFPFKKS